MSKYYKVSEYAVQNGVSERTVRNWIEKGKLSTTIKMIDNRNTIVIIVDEDSEASQPGSELNTLKFQNISEPVQDAEIIQQNTQSYNLVTMENTIFEQLIESIKELANSRADADQFTIKKIEAEYFETKAENKTLLEEIKKLNEKLMEEKIQAAQSQAELKISNLRASELEYKITELENKIDLLNKQILVLQEKPEIQNIKETIISEGNPWYKKL